MLQNDLSRLVNDHGFLTIFRRVRPGSYNPSTGTVTSTSNTDTNVKAYFYNYSLSVVGNGNIISGDRRVVIQVYDDAGFLLREPVVGDQLIDVTDTFSVVTVEKILDRGAVTCYLCQVRK
tara:strand:+ start:849 stop:1208 length:360 start_codon:yes stop_codon:yes gene_type:complete